ncbi:unnamed protein product [Oikopleura dioica]|uniref:Large ribosomal subunit protein eL31 n=1 Tax=Oikopleura dioica TaxID=34765 RepID=E4WWY7_OIKDI|nr:unnamed protein product [Oikopleura dioica]
MSHYGAQARLFTKYPHFRLVRTKYIEMAREKKARSAIKDVIAREYTVNLHKRIFKIGNKHRAPKAIDALRKFARTAMGTKDVRIDARLNKAVWEHGVKNVQYRIRVRLHRKRNEDEDSANKLYTLVTYVPVDTYKGLQTMNVDATE